MTHERDKKSLLAVNLGLGINVGLAALKTTIGVIGHSPALLAEGINSTSDVAYYVVASIFVRMANKPADDEHPYGHQQLESIAALVVGSFIVTTAVAVFLMRSIKSGIFSPGRPLPRLQTLPCGWHC